MQNPNYNTPAHTFGDYCDFPRHEYWKGAISREFSLIELFRIIHQNNLTIKDTFGFDICTESTWAQHDFLADSSQFEKEGWMIDHAREWMNLSFGNSDIEEKIIPFNIIKKAEIIYETEERWYNKAFIPTPDDQQDDTMEQIFWYYTDLYYMTGTVDPDLRSIFTENIEFPRRELFEDYTPCGLNDQDAIFSGMIKLGMLESRTKMRKQRRVQKKAETDEKWDIEYFMKEYQQWEEEKKRKSESTKKEEESKPKKNAPSSLKRDFRLHEYELIAQYLDKNDVPIFRTVCREAGSVQAKATRNLYPILNSMEMKQYKPSVPDGLIHYAAPGYRNPKKKIQYRHYSENADYFLHHLSPKSNAERRYMIIVLSNLWAQQKQSKYLNY